MINKFISRPELVISMKRPSRDHMANSKKRSKASESSPLGRKVMLSLPGTNKSTGPRNIKLTLSELEEFESTMHNFSQVSDKIFSKYLFLKDIDPKAVIDDPECDIHVAAIMRNPLVFFGILLIKQFSEGNLTVINDILGIRNSEMANVVSDIPGGYLTLHNADVMQARLLAIAREAIENLKVRTKSEAKFFKSTGKEIAHIEKDLTHNGFTGLKPLEQLNYTTPESSSLPPLPEIKDKMLLERVFTHKSSLIDVDMINTGKIIHMHNERLELRGDSILDFIICDMLFNNFPDDDEGCITIKKSSLVCNNTLFDISVGYGLHEKIRISSDMCSKVFTDVKSREPNISTRNKVIADLFEAYIAGVAIDQGLMVVKEWLYKLFYPFVETLKDQKSAVPLNKDAKNILYRKVGSNKQPISYIADNSESPFIVKCLINGEHVATGTGRSIKTAGLHAAEAALADPELIEKFARSRRALNE